LFFVALNAVTCADRGTYLSV